MHNVPYGGQFSQDKIFADGSKHESSRMLTRLMVCVYMEKFANFIFAAVRPTAKFAKISRYTVYTFHTFTITLTWSYSKVTK